jgi:hypothetical protein
MRAWPSSLIVAMLAACGGAPPGGTTATGKLTTEIAPNEGEPSWPVGAAASAPSRDDAYAAAVERLEVALYGEQAWAASLEVAVHDRGRDLLREERGANGWRVQVGLTRERAAEVLAGVAVEPIPIEAPVAIARDLERAWRLALVELACARRTAILGEPCGPDDAVVQEGEVASMLSALGRSLTIEPRFEGGIPLDTQNRPLRPATVVVRQSNMGTNALVAGLPLVAEGVDAPSPEPLRTVTGPDGVAVFAPSPEATWAGTLRVTVDAERLLGPLAARWSGPHVRLEGRQAGLVRWTALITERVQGAKAPQGFVAGVLEGAMRERGANRRVALSDEQVARLRRGLGNPATLRTLADELGGRLDVVLVMDVDSEFASRMGAQRVWFEARGRATAFSAWTGRALGRVEAAVTESGVGEARADRAAREELGRVLVQRLFSELTTAS